MRDFDFWSSLFWDVARSILIFWYRRFGTSHLSYFRCFTLEDGSDMWNAVGNAVLGRATSRKSWMHQDRFALS